MAPHAAALLEQTAYPFAQNGVLVPGPHGRALVVAGAATERHGIEHGLEAEPAPDPFHDPRLLPVRRPARVEARAAGFYNRDRPPSPRSPEAARRSAVPAPSDRRARRVLIQ